MKPTLLTIFFLILITCTAFCQHAFGIKANAGISSIPRKAIYRQKDFGIKNYFRPSVQIGAFYTYRLSEKFILGSEILFSLINGKEYWEQSSQVMFTNTYLISYFVTDRSLYSIGLPVYVGYNIRKFNIHLGLQSNFNVANSVGGYSSWNPSYYKEYNVGYRKFDIGVKAGVFYPLSKKLSVELNTYWGIRSLYQPIPSIYNSKDVLKVRQLTLGMRYTLFSNKKKK